MTKPTKPTFRNLGRDEASRELIYHVQELIEAQGTLSGLLEDLDAALDVDADAAIKSLGQLEVELFHHLEYHLTEVRTSFTALLRSVVGPGANIMVDKPETD